MKKVVFLFFLSFVIAKAGAQSLAGIKDSCYYYLEQKDTAAFNRTYIKIYDALEREADPELYALKKELCTMGNRDQSIRYLLIDSQKKYGKADNHTQNIRKDR